MKPINKDESTDLQSIEHQLNCSGDWPARQKARALAMIWGGVLIVFLIGMLDKETLSKQLGFEGESKSLILILGGMLVWAGVEKQQALRDDEIRTMGLSLYRRLRLIEAEEEVILAWKTHRGSLPWGRSGGYFLRLMALSKNGHDLERPGFRIEIELNRMSEWYGGAVDRKEWED